MVAGSIKHTRRLRFWARPMTDIDPKRSLLSCLCGWLCWGHSQPTARYAGPQFANPRAGPSASDPRPHAQPHL
ncbi:hypothetical protein BDW67DRAFT_158459 [Aspergillus spinulosporus]